MTPTEVDLILELVAAGAAAAQSIFDQIKQAVSGKLDPTTVLNQINTMNQVLAKGDAAAEAALDAKFPNG